MGGREGGSVVGRWVGGWVGGRIPSVELKNTRTCPFHVFLKILIPYSSIWRIDQMDLEYSSARVFLQLFDSKARFL